MFVLIESCTLFTNQCNEQNANSSLFFCAYINRIFAQAEGVCVVWFSVCVRDSKFAGANRLFYDRKEWMLVPTAVKMERERETCYIRDDTQSYSFVLLFASCFFSLACLEIKPPVNQITAHLYFLTLQHINPYIYETVRAYSKKQHSHKQQWKNLCSKHTVCTYLIRFRIIRFHNLI